MEQRFWVVNRHKENSSKKTPKVTVHTWKPGKELSAPLWQSKKIPILAGKNKILIPEYPRCLTPSWPIRGDCYLGLNNGSVHSIRAADIPKQKRIETFSSRFSDYNCLRGRERINEEDLVIRGARNIFSLVNFNGKVYDASLAGLFETESGKQIDKKRLSSAGVYRGRLCIVPTHLSRNDEEAGQTYESYQAGSLIDALTKEVIIEKLAPFDGSGYKQAEYLIHEDRAFIHHGDWPCEKITIREFPSGKVLESISIPTSSDFIVHQGQVYDFRDLRQIGETGTGLMKSDVKGEQKPLFRVPEVYTSAVSRGDEGIVLALYDSKRDRSKLISHLNPDKPLLESDGHLVIFSH